MFEYLAAERPILAAVPTDGAAAELIRAASAGEVVGPEDVDGIEETLRGLHARWQAGSLDGPPLSEEWRRKVARRSRVEDLARVLESVTC